MGNALKVKNYKSRIEKNMNGENFYVLSFGSSCHIKVSEKAMAIIELLNGELSNTEILHILNNNGINVTLKELEYFIFDFLLPRNVLVGEDNDTISIEQNKLWFHLPIIESKRFNFIYKFLKVLLLKPVVVLTIILITTSVVSSGLLLLNYKGNFINDVNSLQILMLVYLSMFIHELGHATAAYKYGVSVGKMGIGIYLIYFIFFIDMTNAWELDRKKRIVNDLSGIYFQTFFVLPVFITYMVTNDISLLCAVIIILCTSLMNLIPFLRMDGYWLLTDYLAIQNIQVKAFSSIKIGLGELKGIINSKLKHKSYDLDKQNLFYGIYSLAYIASTTFMLAFISFSIVKLSMNIEDVWYKFTSLYNNLLQGNLHLFFLDLNNIFILILPVIFVIMFIVSAMNKTIKKKRIRRKVGSK